MLCPDNPVSDVLELAIGSFGIKLMRTATDQCRSFVCVGLSAWNRLPQ